MYDHNLKFKNKLLSIAIIVAMLVTMLPIGSAVSYAATSDTYNGESIITGTTKYYSNMGTGKDVPFYYSDGYFKNSPSRYNNHLASASMAMAMSTMINNDGATAKTFLTTIGCTETGSIGYGQAATADTVAARFGSKTIFKGTVDECILVPIVLRSAFYGNEWINNFTVGETGNASGFNSSANQVKVAVDTFVESIGSPEKIKFWVAGYSRGGSVGNILGKMLTDSYGNADVYAYSFESQKTTVDENASTYSNLFVVNNYNDLLTVLYPDYMGFHFYGTEKIIATENDLANNEDAMKAQLAKINTADTGADGEYKSPKNFKYAKLNSDITGLAKANMSLLGSLTILSKALSIISDINNDTFQVVQETSYKNTQRKCGELLVERVGQKALVDRKAYVSNDGRTNKSGKSSINISAAKIDNITPYTMEQACGRIVSFIRNTPSDRLDTLKEEFGKLPFEDIAKNNILKIHGLLKYAVTMELPEENWDEKSDSARFAKLVDFVWGILNNPQGDYIGLAGMHEERTLSDEEYRDIKAGLPILLYTVGALGTKDIGQTPEALASLYYNFDSVAQGHYPEINMAWLMTQDPYYDLLATPAKTATCTEAGNSAYWHCDENNKYFSDPEGKNEIKKDSWIIKATGHTKNHVVYEQYAGYMSHGYAHNHCDACNKDTSGPYQYASGWSTSYLKKLKVSKGKGKFTVKWKKQSKKNRKKFTGYQIQYSAYSPNENAPIYYVKNSKSSRTFKKLAKKTTYYVRVRTYYGSYPAAWSAWKAVKTK